MARYAGWLWKYSQLMPYQYGDMKFEAGPKAPTLNKFFSWFDDFIQLPNVEKYKVWLASGFLEGWNTMDVDIVLNGKPNHAELVELMKEGIRIGLEKYNMFVDIQHWNRKPLNYCAGEMNETLVGKLMYGDKIIKNGVHLNKDEKLKEVYPNLFYEEKVYPTDKQRVRIYNNEPLLLCTN